MTIRRELAARKRSHAVVLRTVLRYTYQQVADAPLLCDLHQGLQEAPPRCPLCVPHLYASRSAALKAVTETLRQDYSATAEDRERLRSELLAGLEVAMARMLTDARSLEEPTDRARAATAYARLSDRYAKLTGVDAPTRLVIDEGLDAELEQAMALLAGTPIPDADQLVEP